MLPTQFSTAASCSASFGSLAVSAGTATPITVDLQPLAPLPAILSLAASGPVSLSEVDLERLPHTDFSNFLSDPTVLGWLTRALPDPMAQPGSSSASSTSSSSSSSGNGQRRSNRIRKLAQFQSHSPPTSKRSKQTREPPAALQRRPPSTAGTHPLQQATLCIRNSALLKTGQQFRDEELDRVLKTFCIPKDLTNMVAHYAAESSFVPLLFSRDGRLDKGDHNKKILDDIGEIFKSVNPDFDRLQNDIIEHHGRTLLTQFFSRAMHTADNLDNLRKIADNDQIALKQRMIDLRMITKFFPYAELEKRLDVELTGHGVAYYPQAREVQKLQQLNAELWMEALKHFDARFEKSPRMVDRLALKEADFFMMQCDKGGNEQSLASASELLLKALAIFCRLNKKNEALRVVIELIKLHRDDRSGEISELFFLTKSLCLKYPAEGRLYANLFFAVDDYCRAQSEHGLAQQLYRQAESDSALLPFDVKSGLLCRRILANLRAGESDLAVMQQINSALAFCISVFKPGGECHTGGCHTYPGAGGIDYYRNVAQLYQCAAQITARQIVNVDRLTEVQLACLIKYHSDIQELIALPNIEVGRYYPALDHPHAAFKTSSREQLVWITTAYSRNALKAMIAAYHLNYGSAKTDHLLASIFDDLVNFYRKSNNAPELERLLFTKNVRHLMRFATFKDRLPVWRKMLKAIMKKSD